MYEPRQPKKGKTYDSVPTKSQKDILDRIKWDNRFSEEDFTIGYLDRFLGVIESDLSAQ
jgi:hypothetical protein